MIFVKIIFALYSRFIICFVLSHLTQTWPIVMSLLWGHTQMPRLQYVFWYFCGYAYHHALFCLFPSPSRWCAFSLMIPQASNSGFLRCYCNRSLCENKHGQPGPKLYAIFSSCQFISFCPFFHSTDASVGFSGASHMSWGKWCLCVTGNLHQSGRQRDTPERRGQTNINSGIKR